MKIFRPTIKYKTSMRERFTSYKHDTSFDWFDNNRRYPSNCQTINRKTMYDIFSRLHYLAWHAPKRVQRKWRGAEKRFRAKHDPSGPHFRWILKYTASNRF